MEIEYSGDMEEDRRDDDVNIVRVVAQSVDGILDKRLSFVEGEVRFPVACNHAFVATERETKGTAPHKI